MEKVSGRVDDGLSPSHDFNRNMLHRVYCIDIEKFSFIVREEQ